ncbi:ABC transporter substrate-binding protein [Pseudosulfitobacter koreensis]|uniref:Sugar ABC transporter substrate-binding protein n=1 Tax=Pseudosulfitobacter koreensis TaxID=2968472 RepID=A0ABT1Z3W4_9RHOB|nr:sugar ABC transporter substrate-binding protein [Pseudosulfitobacter koreense]MCR8827805.1 sugar ABC transporter substrate-binding protein [Pseudosulfitobacter koreense]
MSRHTPGTPAARPALTEMLDILSFVEELSDELESILDVMAPNPHLRMAIHLIRGHLEGKAITPTSLINSSDVPYATATRRMKEMQEAGLIEQRARTKTGKSFSVHPSEKLLGQWKLISGRVGRLAESRFGSVNRSRGAEDYYYGGSYKAAQSIPPLRARAAPLKAPGGIRVLVHADPTFMVMDNLKRQFELVIGTKITQRAFSIDRLRAEALRNASRETSLYDILAVDLPWIGEFASKGVLMPLDQAMDLDQLDPADFHTSGWKAVHWGGRAYGVPAQTTPEMLFYRRDLLDEAGLEPPKTTDQLLDAAKVLHNPARGRYGFAWNAARGTALGHTVLMALADFGQPVLDLPVIAGGFDTATLANRNFRPVIDTDAGLRVAEFLLELLRYSPPNILSMSWYERVRAYAAGNIAMAYGYTLLAPYFEQDDTSPANGQTGYLPHPAGPNARNIAPVGGFVLGIPANLAPDRIPAAVEALTTFTSPAAQKLYVQNGSRTNARYSVCADPEVRSISTIFEAMDEMSWRDELQFWPRPPVPEISDITQILGEEFHDMLRGITTPREALRAAQARADALMMPPNTP